MNDLYPWEHGERINLVNVEMKIETQAKAIREIAPPPEYPMGPYICVKCKKKKSPRKICPECYDEWKKANS